MNTQSQHIQQAAGVSAPPSAGPVVQPHYPSSNDGRTAPVPLRAGTLQDTNVLIDPTRVQQVRTINTNGAKASNFWFELASITRWATTGLLGLTIVSAAKMAFVAGNVTTLAGFTALGSGGMLAAAGAALVNPLVLGLAAGVLVAATVTMMASQHSREIFTNRAFDVQDFQFQRQAALVGRAMQQNIEKAGAGAQSPSSHHGHQWRDKHAPRTAAGSYAEQVLQSKAATQETIR